MNKKIIKYIIELIFIFIIPLGLLATCFKQEKVYDENNNEVGKYLTFDNIFVLTNDSTTYYNYEYYNHNETVYVTLDKSLYVNFNKNQFVNYSFTNVDYLYYIYENNTYVIIIDEYGNLSNQLSTNVEIEYTEYAVNLIRTQTPIEFINTYDNYVKHINTYTISDNVVNRFISYIYDTLGINTNWVLQFIVIYTLLWLVMWFIWHLIYIPIDFLVSHLLIDRVDR